MESIFIKKGARFRPSSRQKVQCMTKRADGLIARGEAEVNPIAGIASTSDAGHQVVIIIAGA